MSLSPAIVEEGVKILRDRGTVMDGIRLGITTDAVATLAASEIGVELIVKATDQNGIYTKDLRKYPGVKKLDKLDFNDLERTLTEDKYRAGIHQIIDPEAVKNIEREGNKDPCS